MRQVFFALLWAFVFFIAPPLILGGLLAAFYWEDPDPPTETVFVGSMCFSPITGIIGLVLGVRQMLPGTWESKRSPDDQHGNR